MRKTASVLVAALATAGFMVLPGAPASTAAMAAPDLTVNTGTRYQTIDGFGAATPIWGSASGQWTTAETQTLVGTGANQLGLSIVRTGVSPDSANWGNAVSSLRTAKSGGSGVKILA
jgi:O-glycosyl hydrolase